MNSKTLLLYASWICFVVRNLAWVLGIGVLIYLAVRPSKCQCSLWNTPIPCPAEIHIPTASEMEDEHARAEERRSECEKALREMERRREQERREEEKRQREKEERKEEEERQRLEEAERVYQERMQALREKRANEKNS